VWLITANSDGYFPEGLESGTRHQPLKVYAFFTEGLSEKMTAGLMNCYFIVIWQSANQTTPLAPDAGSHSLLHLCFSRSTQQT